MRPPQPRAGPDKHRQFRPSPPAETPRALGLAVGCEWWKCGLYFCLAPASRRDLSAPATGPWGQGLPRTGGVSLARRAPTPLP